MLPVKSVLWFVLAVLILHPAVAQPVKPDTLEEVTHSLVRLQAEIDPEGRTASILGLRRVGSGVVIDEQGLIVTIGYLILEAEKVVVRTHDGRTLDAKVMAYDAESGFGLVKAAKPLGVPPLPMGESAPLAEKDPVLVVHGGEEDAVQAGVVVSRRTFAGYWEYLLEKAIFVAPPQADYAGAALVDRNFRLVGIGSLFVQDSASEGVSFPGNMFVPIDLLKPILPTMLRTGRPGTPSRPWLGVNIAEQFGRIIVTRVSEDSPAMHSGLNPGDIILEIGGTKVGTMERFYRELWKLGRAGVPVRLKLLQRNEITLITVNSRDRYQHYRSPKGN